jgi:hypothetical protein
VDLRRGQILETYPESCEFFRQWGGRGPLRRP